MTLPPQYVIPVRKLYLKYFLKKEFRVLNAIESPDPVILIPSYAKPSVEKYIRTYMSDISGSDIVILVVRIARKYVKKAFSAPTDVTVAPIDMQHMDIREILTLDQYKKLKKLEGEHTTGIRFKHFLEQYYGIKY